MATAAGEFTRMTGNSATDLEVVPGRPGRLALRVALQTLPVYLTIALAQVIGHHL